MEIFAGAFRASVRQPGRLRPVRPLPFPRDFLKSFRHGILVVAFSLAFPACTFLAPYDQVTDQAVNELTIKTETALAQADAGQLSAAESEEFLMESIGAVRALKARAGLKEKNTEEQGTLKELEERFQALADRRRPLRRSLATGLRATLLDLQQIQIAKKRSAASAAGLKAKQAPAEH